MRNVLLLFNPHAGKGKINAKLSAITDILTKEGFLVTAYPTQDKGDARDKILQWGSSYDRIIVAGGDFSFRACCRSRTAASPLTTSGRWALGKVRVRTP